MSEVYTFEADEIINLRQRASSAWETPLSKLEGTEGWSISEVDPMRVLKVFKALKIKPGYVLRAYQFRAGSNGNGVVYALPHDALFPAPDPDSDLFKAPRPQNALKDYMDAIEGDGTPWSYLSASLLARELSEFGAIWHGVSWAGYRILYDDPFENGVIEFSNPLAWEWSGQRPKQWQPKVFVSESRVKVQFFVFRGHVPEGIIKYSDNFKPGKYDFRVTHKDIGRGPGGYIY